MSRLRLMQDRHQKGMVFYAVGNEPFWSLDLKKNDQFIFNVLDGPNITFPKTKPETDGKTTYYKTGDTLISITQEPCNDTMSEEIFEYSVSIRHKGVTYFGCGNDVPDFGLHDIWVVTKIKGIPLSKDIYQGNLPMMEINLTKSVVMGSDGCNRFSGKVKAHANKIEFGPLAGTLKACAHENNMTVLLSGNEFNYKNENGSLLIYDEKGPVIELKHID